MVNWGISKWKVIVVIVLGIMIYLSSVSYSRDECSNIMKECVYVEDVSCEDVFSFRLFSDCNSCDICDRATTSDELTGDLIKFFLPFVLIYIAWSLFEKKK